MDWKTVINFWFKECTPRQWFKKDKTFDTKLRKRFLKTYWQVVQGETSDWRKSAKGRVAEIIVLDQFARNIFRNSPQAFAYDPLALSLAQEVVARGDDKKLRAVERHFLYMPYMHSESKKIQRDGLKLFTKLSDKHALSFAKDHKKIIDRFGRFPHRNSILGRKSTAAEKKFMRTHKGF